MIAVLRIIIVSIMFHRANIIIRGE